ncbi:MAG TPA: OsmC family protein [Actinomycetes bacterium]|nr:OsmC family protein [Actinomycetes bacterium]
MPNPGDLLCAALAACTDSTIRMAAEAFGVTLEDLQVEVTSDWDARGALGVDRHVRVGLQALDCRIHLRPASDTDPRLIEKVLAATQRYCVILDTLRHGVEVNFDVQHAKAHDAHQSR